MNKQIKDPYAEADHLIADLRGIGFEDEAQTLHNAIYYGSTGTEIHMALRWSLRALLKSDLPQEIRERAMALERYLDNALLDP